ncbi:MAG: histidine phosphatase family protein [Dethiobacteria bacterium]|jgi:broad specificity phosphatase PhoE
MELWLIRHSTTGANLEGRLQGTLDYPLCSKGRSEAFCLAKRLEGQRFSAFFCSSQLRARETAKIIISKNKNIKPLYTPLLREYNWGVAQGLTIKEIAGKYPDLARNFQRGFQHAKIPGAEGIRNLFKRVKIFFNFLFVLEKNRLCTHPLLVLSHGRFLHAFLLHFLDMNPQGYWPFSFSPASITILESDFRLRKRVKLFNDTCHLRGVQDFDSLDLEK